MTYGVSDEEAAGVGLMCGGTVRVFVHEHGDDALDALDAVADARAAGEPVALATLLDGERAGAKMAILGDRRGRRPRGHRAARPLRRARRARPARRGGLADPPLRRRRRGDGLRAGRLHPGVLDPAADGDLRRDRLLRRDGEARQRDRLPGHDLRRPPSRSSTARGSRASPRWSSTGPTATWRARSSGRATWCSSSPTTRSSTSPR